MSKLSIIILTYNTKSQTIRCLESLIKQYHTQLQGGLFEIIVFDNASNDETIKEVSSIKYQVSSIKIIRNEENLGFSKGINFAAKHAKGDFLLFLNSDAVVVDDGFIKVIEYMNSQENVGVVGVKMENKLGITEKSAGADYGLIKTFFVLFGLNRFTHLPSKTQPVDWVSGGCMFVKHSVFNKLGGFDEKLFMYMEDVEFCYRVRKLGLNVVYYPSVSVMHFGQGSSNKTFAITQIYKGLLYFYKKHKSSKDYTIVKSMLLLKALVAFGIGTITGNPYLKNTYKQAIKLSL